MKPSSMSILLIFSYIEWFKREKWLTKTYPKTSSSWNISQESAPDRVVEYDSSSSLLLRDWRKHSWAGKFSNPNKVPGKYYFRDFNRVTENLRLTHNWECSYHSIAFTTLPCDIITPRSAYAPCGDSPGMQVSTWVESHRVFCTTEEWGVCPFCLPCLFQFTSVWPLPRPQLSYCVICSVYFRIKTISWE